MHVRRLMDSEEMAQASRLESEVWGNLDPSPTSLLMVFAHHGGVVLGAFHGHQMVGVSVGFPGLDHEGTLYLHSHVLAVSKPFRRQRIGEALKRAQWEYAHERQLPYIGWTYDPLMGPNAWLNLEVLGAQIAALQENVYGELRDEINGNLPTHRLWVVWRSNAQSEARPLADGREMTIPTNVTALRRHDPQLARQQSEQFFSEMTRWWSDGWRIAGVKREGSSFSYRWIQETMTS